MVGSSFFSFFPVTDQLISPTLIFPHTFVNLFFSLGFLLACCIQAWRFLPCLQSLLCISQKTSAFKRCKYHDIIVGVRMRSSPFSQGYEGTVKTGSHPQGRNTKKVLVYCDRITGPSTFFFCRQIFFAHTRFWSPLATRLRFPCAPPFPERLLPSVARPF